MNRVGKTITLAGAVILLMGVLTGCAISYTYNNADKYTAGDRVITDNIENIDINYLSGSVEVLSSSTNEISIRETANKELDEDHSVHTWVDGNTLYVKYCASGSGLVFTDYEKKLEISVPSALSLKEFKTDISSGTMKTTAIKADRFDVDASSGSIDLDCEAREINVDISSGNVMLHQHGSSDSIRLDASSGSLMAEIEKATRLSVDVSSGSCIVNADGIDDIHYDASSGRSSFNLGAVPKNSYFNASSGDIELILPENADLSADVDTSSGDFSYELPFEKSGETYKCGSGTNRMVIDTSSGDVSIKKR